MNNLMMKNASHWILSKVCFKSVFVGPLVSKGKIEHGDQLGCFLPEVSSWKFQCSTLSLTSWYHLSCDFTISFLVGYLLTHVQLRTTSYHLSCTIS